MKEQPIETIPISRTILVKHKKYGWVEVVLGPLQTLMWGYIGRKYVYNIDFEDSRTLWAEVIE